MIRVPRAVCGVCATELAFFLKHIIIIIMLSLQNDLAPTVRCWEMRIEKFENPRERKGS